MRQRRWGSVPVARGEGEAEDEREQAPRRRGDADDDAAQRHARYALLTTRLLDSLLRDEPHDSAGDRRDGGDAVEAAAQEREDGAGDRRDHRGERHAVVLRLLAVRRLPVGVLAVVRLAV